MDPETPETESFWSKKQTDMTVGDGLKLGVGVIVVTTVLPFAVIGTIAGVQKISEKLRERKDRKAAEKAKEATK